MRWPMPEFMWKCMGITGEMILIIMVLFIFTNGFLQQNAIGLLPDQRYV